MDIEIIGTNLQFPEGPIAISDGSLLIVEIARGTLTRLENGKAEVVAELGGGPNGAAMGPDGNVYICNNGGRFEFIRYNDLLFPGPLPPSHEGGSIQRVDLQSGRAELLYDACDGHRLKAPNDIVFDRQGGFWFTDYGTGNHDGGLYYAKSDGSGIRCWKDGQASPNGVGLSPDERVVYVADTSLRHLFGFDIETPGVLADGHEGQDWTLLVVPENHSLDSLALEADGTVCIGTLGTGGITVRRPDGTSAHVPMPDAMTTNLCFGGHDMREAYITLSSSGCIGKACWPREGLRLNYQR